MNPLFSGDSHKKFFGLCQISLLLLALFLQLGATSGLRWLVDMGASHVYGKMCALMLVTAVPTLVLLLLYAKDHLPSRRGTSI